MKNILILSLLVFFMAVEYDLKPGQHIITQTTKAICKGLDAAEAKHFRCRDEQYRRRLELIRKLTDPNRELPPRTIRFYNPDGQFVAVDAFQLNPEMFRATGGIGDLTKYKKYRVIPEELYYNMRRRKADTERVGSGEIEDTTTPEERRQLALEAKTLADLAKQRRLRELQRGTAADVEYSEPVIDENEIIKRERNAARDSADPRVDRDLQVGGFRL